MIARQLTKRLASSPKSILLLGPRQTGKSTLIRSLNPDIEINLARESEYLAFASRPAELEERLAAQPAAGTIFVDEVQRIPSLLNTVQAALDEARYRNQGLKFYLAGSSARKLKRGRANLLPGRVLNYSLGPLAAMELGYKVDARRALELGCLPEPYLENDRSLAEKLLDSYAGSYLREEIQSEALSRNLEGFSRFLATAAAGSGQFLDFSKLSQRARVARTSAIRYFDVLEDTLIAYRIPPYPDAQKADLVQHPRYYFFDPGVLNGILGNFTASPDRIGILFETLLVSQLRAAAMARDIRMELFTFRTRGGVEVDFIVRLPNGLWAIEANASSHIHEGDARSLEQFRTYCSEEAHCVVVTLSGVKRKLESGTLILPWTELLKEMGL